MTHILNRIDHKPKKHGDSRGVLMVRRIDRQKKAVVHQVVRPSRPLQYQREQRGEDDGRQRLIQPGHDEFEAIERGFLSMLGWLIILFLQVLAHARRSAHTVARRQLLHILRHLPTVYMTIRQGGRVPRRRGSRNVSLAEASSAAAAPLLPVRLERLQRGMGVLCAATVFWFVFPVLTHHNRFGTFGPRGTREGAQECPGTRS
mmetsp:Transcript_19407/g.44891  ORF Transcript_19407/g.44891 Transcript_19407/m.44891 type:complete len:203 (+) Transcript_19407:141-749(+)